MYMKCVSCEEIIYSKICEECFNDKNITIAQYLVKSKCKFTEKDFRVNKFHPYIQPTNIGYFEEIKYLISSQII